MDAKSIALRPRMSEKTYALSQSENTFVFDVPKEINKVQVTEAVQAQFGVTVEDIRILIVKGKVKASPRRRSRSVSGKRADVKKAYVRLKEGDSIPVFAAIEEAEAKEKKAQEKAAKKKGAK